MTAAGCTSECSLLKYDVMFIEHVRTIVPLRCSFLHHSSQRASESARTAHTHTHTQAPCSRRDAMNVFQSAARRRPPFAVEQPPVQRLVECVCFSRCFFHIACLHIQTHTCRIASVAIALLFVRVCVRARMFVHWRCVCALCPPLPHLCQVGLRKQSRRPSFDPRSARLGYSFWTRSACVLLCRVCVYGNNRTRAVCVFVCACV